MYCLLIIFHLLVFDRRMKDRAWPMFIVQIGFSGIAKTCRSNCLFTSLCGVCARVSVRDCLHSPNFYFNTLSTFLMSNRLNRINYNFNKSLLATQTIEIGERWNSLWVLINWIDFPWIWCLHLSQSAKRMKQFVKLFHFYMQFRGWNTVQTSWMRYWNFNF